ncbi:MAG: hypothetical protein ACI86H_001184 [bacterium]
MIEVEIEDTGVGYKKYFADQIFHLGFRTKNGEVSFTSEGQGKGGKVQVKLPIHSEVSQVAS